ncbi:hypothetical protein [Gaopeijia maritima]|uniref:Uncharacterized protein n=1 Tax=Gaopeijia maritima TaxID=3119007 RepID=A0ABU9E7I0_9BACT
MKTWSVPLLVTAAIAAPLSAMQDSAEPTTIRIERAMVPPAWVAAQRTLLESTVDIALDYAAANFHANGHLIRSVPPAWGAGDGPDDIVNRAKDWPLIYLMGGPEELVDELERIWEGHLEQYTDGRVPEVEAARDGIFRNDFITQFDWEHTSEELAAFYMYALARPNDPTNRVRARRFAGLYMNEDPAAPNYDPDTKIIRSLFNGSLGPKLTPVVPADWEGLSPSLRFWSVAATDVRGDHPMNMAAAMLPFTAFILTQEEKYREWALEYIGAWRDRTEANGGNIPSNIGLDGTIGGEWGGKWYCGVWGWTGEGERNYVFRGPPEGFDVALLLSGDPSYTQAMRHQVDNLFEARRVEDGRVLYPHLYDENGWGGYAELSTGTLHVQRGNGSGTQGNLVNILVDLYITSLRQDDLDRIPVLPDDRSAQRAGVDTPPGTDWIDYLRGNDPGYPMRALEAALATVREKAVPSDAAPRGSGLTSVGWLGVEGLDYPSSVSMMSLDRLPPMRDGIGGCVPENGARITATSPAEVSVAAARRDRGEVEPATVLPEVDPGVGGNGAIPIAALVQLTMGGPNPGGESHGPLPLNVQVRHFDPVAGRPGLPADVGALVEKFDAESVTLTLVNAHPLQERTVTVQMGAYGEHTATEVTVEGSTTPVDAPFFEVRLAPGSGQTLTIGVRRYTNLPTAAFPWDRPAF